MNWHTNPLKLKTTDLRVSGLDDSDNEDDDPSPKWTLATDKSNLTAIFMRDDGLKAAVIQRVDGALLVVPYTYTYGVSSNILNWLCNKKPVSDTLLQATCNYYLCNQVKHLQRPFKDGTHIEVIGEVPQGTSPLNIDQYTVEVRAGTCPVRLFDLSSRIRDLVIQVGWAKGNYTHLRGVMVTRKGKSELVPVNNLRARLRLLTLQAADDADEDEDDDDDLTTKHKPKKAKLKTSVSATPATDVWCPRTPEGEVLQPAQLEVYLDLVARPRTDSIPLPVAFAGELDISNLEVPEHLKKMLIDWANAPRLRPEIAQALDNYTKAVADSEGVLQIAWNKAKLVAAILKGLDENA